MISLVGFGDIVVYKYGIAINDSSVKECHSSMSGAGVGNGDVCVAWIRCIARCQSPLFVR